MTMRARVVRSARPIVAGAVVSMFAAGSARAQEIRAVSPLNLSAATAAALDVAAGPAAAAELQAPAPDPAVKQDAATMDFFRRTEISGFADTYYTYNFNKPAAPCVIVNGTGVFNCLYNFNITHSSFSLNFAEVAFEKKPTADSRGGFRLDLDYGTTAALVHSLEPSGSSTTGIFQNIEQAYVSFLAPAGGGLQFDFGKFVTPMGNEVIETKDNWNYSRGLLFALAIPYYHMGLRAAYTVNDQVTLTGFLVNGWNNVVDNNTGKTIGASVAVKPVADVALIGTYLGGPEQSGNNDDWRHTLDAIVTVALNKEVSVALNYDYGQDTIGSTTVKWQGVAGYLKYQANDWFAVTPRVEYYDDKNGFSTGVVQKVKEVTLTGEFKHKDGVMMRLEYRRDFSDVPFFLKNTTESVKNQDTFTIGLVYAFSTKAQ